MAAASERLRLSRTRRVRQSREFRRIKSAGERLSSGCLILNWQRLENERFSRLGVITGRRVGGAVQRNHARRLLREAFRRNQPRLAVPVAVVLVARPSIAGSDFSAVERDYLTALRRARLLDARPAP